MSKDYPWGKGTPTWVLDATANDSDKSFTVPAGKIWRLISIYAEITCTATVGNRVLAISMTNGTSVIDRNDAQANTTASQIGNFFVGYGTPSAASTTARRILAGTSNATTTTSIGDPERILLAGYVVRVFDRGAVDPAADDLTVVLHYVEYDA